MAATLTLEAVKAILYGIIAHLISEAARDYMDEEEWQFPGKPRDVPAPVWNEIRKHYDAVCECTDDPEALEICRDRLIKGLESQLPTRSGRK